MLASWWFLQAAVPLAVAAAIGLPVWFFWLDQRPSVDARVEVMLKRSFDPRTSGSFAVSGKDSSFELKNISARVINIPESTGLDIELPLSKGMCPKLSGCRGGELETVPTFTIAWAKRPGPMSASRIHVDEERASFQTGGIVSIVSRGSSPSQICLSAPIKADSLRLKMGGGVGPPALDAFSTDVVCDIGQAVRVHVAHGQSDPGQESLSFERVNALSLVFKGSSLELDGLKAGTVHVQGATHIDAEKVTLRGGIVKAAARLAANGILLTGSALHARSVKDANRELVRTRFAHYETWLQTLVGALGFGVLTLLRQAGKGLRDKIGGSQCTAKPPPVSQQASSPPPRT